MSELPTIPEGRHVAPAKKKSFGPAFWSAVGAAVAGAGVVLANLAGSGVAEGTQRQHRKDKEPTTLEEKVDELRDTVRGMAEEQGRQGRDIAVIKRQLGLDGLGPPAPSVRTSTTGR